MSHPAQEAESWVTVTDSDDSASESYAVARALELDGSISSDADEPHRQVPAQAAQPVEILVRTPPVGATRGQAFLAPLVQIIQRGVRVGANRELPVRLAIEGELGADYGGVFKDAVSDFLEYWFPTATFRFKKATGGPKGAACPLIGYQVNWPRIHDLGEVDPAIFGRILAFLVDIVVHKPTIRGVSVDIGLGLTFDQLWWAVYKQDDLDEGNSIGYFLDNLSARDKTTILTRLVANHTVTIDNYGSIPIATDITRIVTEMCQSVADLNRMLAGSRYQRLVNAIIANEICKWSEVEDDLISSLSESDEPLDDDKLVAIIRQELGRLKITEFEYLKLWIDVYGRYLSTNREVQAFTQGVRDYCQSRDINATEVEYFIHGDRYNDATLREAIVNLLEPEHKRMFQLALGEMSYEQVRDLLKFWTGTDQLGSYLKVDRQAPSGNLPAAHTCFNSLDVPANLLEDPLKLRDGLLRSVELGRVGTGLI